MESTINQQLPFEGAEYANRLVALRNAMREANVDVAVISAPDTAAWLHGYRSRWYRQHTSTSLPPVQYTVVHVSEGQPFMIDSAYHEELARETSVLKDFRAIPSRSEMDEPTLADIVGYLRDQLHQWRGCAVGVERWSCLPNPAVADEVARMLQGLGCSIVDVSVPFRRARRLKSAAEIKKIEQAQAACDAGILALQKQVTPQTTELEAWALYSLAMVRAGGEPAVLHETVAAGSSVSALHRLSTRLELGSGPMFYPDMAASVDGYHARCDRPMVFGRVPEDIRREMAITVGAFDVVLQYGTVGTPWQVLIDALRQYWVDAGVDGGMAGYELGCSVAPGDWVGEFLWSTTSDMDGVIEPGLVTNIEAWSSVFLVDTIVFEEAGPRLLSALPRKVLEVAP